MIGARSVKMQASVNMHRILANGCGVTGDTAAKTGCFMQSAISAAATRMRASGFHETKIQASLELGHAPAYERGM